MKTVNNKRNKSSYLLVIPLLAFSLSGGGCGDDMSSPETTAAGNSGLQQQRETAFVAHLNSVNDSGVSGEARIVLDGTQLTVSFHASGLEPGSTHPQYVRGWGHNKANSMCPPASADDDGDGVISLGEASWWFGPVLLMLEPFTTTSESTVAFEQSFTIDPDVFRPLQNRTIVLHGMTVNGEYVPTQPVACGPIAIN